MTTSKAKDDTTSSMWGAFTYIPAKHSMRLVHFLHGFTPLNYPNVGKHTIKLSAYISPSCRLNTSMDMDGLSRDSGLITNSWSPNATNLGKFDHSSPGFL